METFPVDSLFFDFDGTLGDTRNGIHAAWRKTFAEIGIPSKTFETDFRVGPPVEQQVIATTKTVQVDLSEYTAVVQVRIEVGGAVQHNSPVDPTTMSTFSKTITGTGTQLVVIYVNDEIKSSSMENFGQ